MSRIEIEHICPNDKCPSYNTKKNACNAIEIICPFAHSTQKEEAKAMVVACLNEALAYWSHHRDDAVGPQISEALRLLQLPCPMN